MYVNVCLVAMGLFIFFLLFSYFFLLFLYFIHLLSKQPTDRSIDLSIQTLTTLTRSHILAHSIQNVCKFELAHTHTRTRTFQVRIHATHQSCLTMKQKGNRLICV